MKFNHDIINEALDAYIGAALWSSNDESDDSGGEPMDNNYGPGDIASETLRKMRKDVKDFMVSNAELILNAEVNEQNWSRWALAGHDFWLTRNGHGAGFWDGDWMPRRIGEALTKASKAYGEIDLYVGDDGKIYSS
jgi:hypothetical protein